MNSRKTNKDRRVMTSDYEFKIKLNNRGGIVEITPRVYDMYYVLYGRQFSKELVQEVYEQQKEKAIYNERWK